MKQVHLFAAMLVLVFVGCNKKEIQQPSAPTGPAKIKQISGSNGLTLNYTYDNDGRITTAIWGSGQKTVYTYATSTVYEKMYDNAGVQVSQVDHETNFLGNVVLTTYGVNNPSRTNYLYNSNGQLTLMHFFSGPFSDSSDTQYFYSAAGKLDSSIVSRNNFSVRIRKYIYEYGLDRPNTISTVNSGQLFRGTSNSSTPVTKTTVVNPDGSIQRIDNYSYEYDMYNRITKANYGPGSFEVFTYY